MLLGAKQSVEDFVIQILAQHGDYTVEDLKAIISEQWHQDITIQGIYRVLRKLQRDGIVVKEKRFYSLRVPWILHVREMLDRMEETYLQEKFLSRYLPSSEEETYTWIFSNLIKLSDFYLQLLFALVHASEDKIIYQYHPHPWFNLPQLDQGQKFNTIFLEKTHYNFVLIGSVIPFWIDILQHNGSSMII
ncbi:MAG: hypothetical protein COU30_04655 [Candidatus Magasanikbacteria bacterium CG10_big_fil_rev_8_21_14_0_10_38_6]|uniref:Uncharacterized protein n=1 Tax=Candidatus Magasanikbacteria bacterium CG10_big_fil_rev_8_21_14_0_10_38_6 TaxID=1974647 RepID=A0A2M6P024_9BACT|nr:MAG: hypothetical protein COU30_04655 [Candidatus Magasanikbacteria bacterium CG10_big_fil_rev_8_21_14_0_10_38_6]